jgi:hypothetical protein
MINKFATIIFVGTVMALWIIAMLITVYAYGQ